MQSASVCHSVCNLPQPVLALVKHMKMEGPVLESRTVSLGKQRQVANLVWFWCSYKFTSLELTLSTCVLLFPFPTRRLSTPLLAERLCGTHTEMLAMIPGRISSLATALRSPNSGVKLPLLVSPLISYGNDSPSTLHLLSSSKATPGSSSLFTLVHFVTLLLHWASFLLCQNPLGFQQLQSMNLLRTFFYSSTTK